jgi:signal transduction histidine kinase/HD-like signal output (HDOD) protein
MILQIPDIKSRLLAAPLPALPQVLVKLMHSCASDDEGMGTLADLVAQDAALAAKVLQVATSPVYHHGPHPANIKQALATIGLNMVRTLLVTQSVYQTFHDVGPGLDLRAFWAHGIETGITARMLAQRQGYSQPEEAYLAGLLHDIGRLALVMAAPEQYAANFFAKDGRELCALEERTLEITHPEAGALLLERMNLDSFLADSIRYHHTELVRLHDAHPLVRIVAAADQLMHLSEMDAALRAHLLGATGFSEEAYLKHKATVASHVQRVAVSLGIDMPAAPPAQAAARAVEVFNAATDHRGPLQDSMRDLILIDKTLGALRCDTDPENRLRAIARAAVILFDFSDAVVLEPSAQSGALAPVALPPGRQRLADLSIPANKDNLAGRVSIDGQPAVLAPPGTPSVADEQLLRFFNAEALVALCIPSDDDRPLVLLGATTAVHAKRLQERLPLLREFGGQAGAQRAAAAPDTGKHADGADLENKFLLASRRIAHEISNPLTIIRNYLTVLQRKAESDQPIGAELGIMKEELDRVGHIIHEFVQPAGAAPVDTASDVNAALTYVTRLFADSATVPAGLQLSRHVSPEPAMAAIDGGSLRQVLVNLVKNAVEAMPHGGRIDLRNNGIVERDGANYVAVSIGDTGPGIPDSLRARLFEPMTSTKEGGNRGLGLSIVRELVRRSGGHIACRSSRGGTVFELALPAVSTLAAPAPG